MWTDVVDLQEFYATGRGVMVRRLMRRRLRALWPDVRGDTVVGLGYAVPFLHPFAEQADRTVALMPAPQGAVRWPAGGRNLVALCEETPLPLADLSADRILMVHMLEFSGQLRPLLRELWRVLADGGRLMVVAPNRRSIWARLEGTPFSQGRPWSVGQLTSLLHDNMFTPLQVDRAIHFPPTEHRMMLGAAPAWERIGSRWFPGLGGVNLVEAGKQLYAGTPVRETARNRLATAPAGSRQPLAR